MFVHRYVRKLSSNTEEERENPPIILSDLRNLSAWALLGEPGAGKSEAFKMEAEAVGGCCLRIDEFVEFGLDAPWKGKPLFLDGLDEVRADCDRLLLKVQKALRDLGRPPFRIACRAADWQGLIDTEDLKSASPNGQLKVYVLEPLREADILAILQKNHDITDPDNFIKEAHKRGIADLLENPKALELLALAIKGGQWPQSRAETFQLACSKLATEHNRRHRLKSEVKVVSDVQILESAGYLAAALLLSNKTGIALDPDLSNDHYPTLKDYAPPNLDIAERAVRSMLFRPAGAKEERLIPTHRSVAEYLAAVWLAQQIDQYKLPLKRVLNLLLGRDGRTVAGLRGLYGWLTLHCLTARGRLLDADPLTVVIYGDVKPMPPADRKRILDALKRETEQHLATCHEVQRSAQAFRCLFDEALTEYFQRALETPSRDEVSQSFAQSLLIMLLDGGISLPSGLLKAVNNILIDETCWPGNRTLALRVLLSMGVHPLEALTLLSKIADGHRCEAGSEAKPQAE